MPEVEEKKSKERKFVEKKKNVSVAFKKMFHHKVPKIQLPKGPQNDSRGHKNSVEF
jgi:hypothetical protein